MVLTSTTRLLESRAWYTAHVRVLTPCGYPQEAPLQTGPTQITHKGYPYEPIAIADQYTNERLFAILCFQPGR